MTTIRISVDDAAQTLEQARYLDGEVVGEDVIEVELDLDRGDMAFERKDDTVTVTQNALQTVLSDAELVVVSE